MTVVKTANPVIRSQPQYASLAVLERDNDMSYKVSNTSIGASGKEKIIEECQVSKEIDSLLANTTMTSNSDETLPLNTVEKIPQVKKSEIILRGKQVPAPKVSGPVVGPSADGWGSAFKSSGIGAKMKKPTKGLSMAKPFTIKKNPSSNSLIDIAESIDREKRDVGLAITRSFDDLKQIGRLQRDLMAQQLEEVPSKRISSNRNLSMSIEDFPSLDVLPPPPPPQKATNGKNSSSYGSSSIDSTIPVPPTLPPGLSIEQRNESIKAFVEEVRRKKELDQFSSSSSEKDCKSKTSSTDTKTTKNKSNNWAKTGGVTENVDAISNKSVSSISDVDYPSLSQMKITQSTSNIDILKWGEKPPPPPPKSASDLLLAKKNKAANKIKNPRIS